MAPPARALVPVTLALALAAGAPAGRAQSLGGSSSSAPDSRGRASGEQDGRQQGVIEGSDLGRDQVLVKAFVEAFKAALEASEKQRDEVWRETGREAARADAAVTGSAAGERAGRQAALGRAGGTQEEAPEPPLLPAGLDTCRPPDPLTLGLPSQRLVTFDLGRMPRAGVGLGYEIPDPELPDQDRLRSRGRVQERLQGMDLDLWTEGYRRGFRDAFTVAYHEERLHVSAEKRAELAAAGALAGELEGRRRAACRVLAEAWREEWPRAWSGAWQQAFERARADLAARLAAGTVIALEDATLSDRDDDGVLAPGDEVVLRGRLVGLGHVAADGDAGRWRALRGFASAAEGPLGPAPPAGGDLSLEIAVGRVDGAAPIRASLVVLVEPVGGGRETVVAKVGRPVVVDRVDADLDAESGALVARIAAVVRCGSRAGSPAGLRVVAGDAAAPVPALGPGATAVVTVVAPVASPAALGSEAPGVRVVLRDGDGIAWDDADALLSPSVDRLIDVAERLVAPTALLEALATRLTRALPGAVEDPSAAEAGEGELAAYARARQAAAPDMRARLDRAVTEPLLGALDELRPSRRARKALRDLLGA